MMNNFLKMTAAAGVGVVLATASFADTLKLSLSYEPSSAHFKWAEAAAESNTLKPFCEDHDGSIQ